MFKKKFIISSTLFILLLIFTSIVKNKTRLIEKKITNLKIKVASQEKNINEAQLDFFYLTSPEEIEKKLNEIGFNNYQPIEYSKIYFSISDLTNNQNKVSILKKLNEEKTQKR